jgi:WD40 repeat protein
LEWLPEAAKCLENFREKHPEHKKSSAFAQRENDLNLALAKKSATTSSRTGASAEPAAPSSPVLSQYSSADFLRPDDGDDIELMDSDDDSDDGGVGGPAVDHPGGIGSRLGSISAEHSKQESELRLKAKDYSARFLGACNTTTDIKEANFLGRNGQFIMAGSDDGKFFIWDRRTTNIVKVLVGDEAIVNCLQGHPTAPILATSGIDPVVRLWQPAPEDGQENARAVGDLEAAASSNQRRMNADPFETILLNMGYRMNVDDDAGEVNEDGGAVQCRPS